jgi:hypothetical protein
LPYQDEESIKADLRALTEKTRKLRHELRAMVTSGPAKDLTRGNLHVQGRLRPGPPVALERRKKPRSKV